MIKLICSYKDYRPEAAAGVSEKVVSEEGGEEVWTEGVVFKVGGINHDDVKLCRIQNGFGVSEAVKS